MLTEPFRVLQEQISNLPFGKNIILNSAPKVCLLHFFFCLNFLKNYAKKLTHQASYRQIHLPDKKIHYTKAIGEVFL